MNTNPLIKAAQNNDLKTIERYIKKNADVNMQDQEGCSALYWSAIEGNLDAVTMLVEDGKANMDVCDVDNTSPLLAALQEGHLDIAEYLLDQGADGSLASNDWSPIHAAAAQGALHVLKKLLKHGVDTADCKGCTALHWATQEGFEEIVSFLVTNGASIDTEDMEGFTPLSLAVGENKIRLVSLLLDRKASINVKREAPLHKACAYNFIEIVKVLLAAGADVEFLDEEGKRAIDYAIENNCSDVIKLLTSE